MTHRDEDFVRRFMQRVESLSDDELDVMEAICDGWLNKQIAKALGISIRTVEQRRRRVFEKMGVTSAIPLAREVGVVQGLVRRSLRVDAAHNSRLLSRITAIGSESNRSPSGSP